MQVANFTKQFGKGDYARPNLFQLSFAGLEFGDVAAVAKAASFPAATVGVIEVPYKNRKLKFLVTEHSKIGLLLSSMTKTLRLERLL